MIKDQWIQKAKALLFDMQFACESNQLNREAAKLIEEAGGYDPYNETSETDLQWGSGFLIPLEEIDNANAVGEILREWAFKEPVGCYSCFDLIDGFEELNVNDDLAIEVVNKVIVPEWMFAGISDGRCDTQDIHEYILRAKVFYHKEKNVIVAWYWDGDGELYFNADGIEVYNSDCKKDYRWEFVEEML